MATLTEKLYASQQALGEEAIAANCGLKIRMFRLFITRQRRLGARPLGTIARNFPRLRDDVVQYLIDEWADSAPSEDEQPVAA